MTPALMENSPNLNELDRILLYVGIFVHINFEPSQPVIRA